MSTIGGFGTLFQTWIMAPPQGNPEICFDILIEIGWEYQAHVVAVSGMKHQIAVKLAPKLNVVFLNLQVHQIVKN